MICMSTEFGAGHHQAFVPFSDLKPTLQINYGEVIIYQLCIALTKISICLFNLRLFADRRARQMMIGTMVFILLYFIPCELLWIFQCWPIASFYDKSVAGKCANPMAGFYTNAGANVLVDIWLITFVAPRIWPLKMAFRQKAALPLVITLGWLVAVATIIRTYRISQIADELDVTCKQTLCSCATIQHP